MKEAKYDDNLEECIIVDFDDALIGGVTFDTTGGSDSSRNRSIVPNDAVDNIMGMAFGHGYRVIIVTSFGGDAMDSALTWLEQQGIDYDKVIGRKSEDKITTKKTIYKENIEGKYNVKYVIDKDPGICEMWKNLGLPVLQVW